jgi:hypothetical protein
MTFDYETVMYDTSASNKIAKDNPSGFAKTKYDATPSPLSIGGVGTNSILGENGIMAGAGSVFGSLGSASSPLDFLNAGLNAATLAKNIKNVSKASITAEGYSILNGTLGNMAADPNGTKAAGVGASFMSGIQQAVSPVGINLSMGVQTLAGAVTAIPKKINGGGGG